MSTAVYTRSERVPVGILKGNYLYDSSGSQVLARTDSQGRLYNSPDATGSPDFVLVGDEVRDTCSNGMTVFTIRGNGICDGNGTLPTFYCESASSDNRIALALTAISHVGDLRFRTAGASVIPRSMYLGGGPRENLDKDLDYSKVYGHATDPYSKLTVPYDLDNNYKQEPRSTNSWDNIQQDRTPPSSRSNITASEAVMINLEADLAARIEKRKREEAEEQRLSASSSIFRHWPELDEIIQLSPAEIENDRIRMEYFIYESCLKAKKTEEEYNSPQAVEKRRREKRLINRFFRAIPHALSVGFFLFIVITLFVSAIALFVWFVNGVSDNYARDQQYKIEAKQNYWGINPD